MKEETIVLGKISNVVFGKRDNRIGLWLTLSGGYSVQTNYTCWDVTDITPDKNHNWTEDDRDVELIKIMRKLSELLSKAKVNTIGALLNTPVEMTFKDSLLLEWRILEEVL